MQEAVKVGLNRGAGPLPGYLWSVHFLATARREALQFLTEDQYAHVVDLMRSLASERDPTHPVTVEVEQIEDFYELKDKGGVLGKINLRVYFTVASDTRVILVLAAVKKEDEGQTPGWIKTRVRFRMRKFHEQAVVRHGG